MANTAPRMPPEASLRGTILSGALLTCSGFAWGQVPAPAGFDLAPLGGPGPPAIAAPYSTPPAPGAATPFLAQDPAPAVARRGLDGTPFPALVGGLPGTDPGPPVISSRGYTLSPSIAGQVLATDNAQGVARGKRGDIITSITPGILGTVDTARLQGVLEYAPTVQIYASDTRQTRLLQRLNGQLLVSVLPQTLFLDLRGSANTQAASGGFAPQSSPVVNRNNQVQTTAFSASPYLLHRFGDLATVQVGYAFQSVNQELAGGSTSLTTPGGQRIFTNQRFTANEGFAVARTGPAFGRLALEARLVSTDYDGTGVLRAAYRRNAVVEARYSVTGWFALLADGGYTSQRYAGTPGLRLDEPIWGAGARFTLGPESFVTLRYQRRDGFDAPAADAAIALGGRTRLYASYGERLTTGAQRAADFLTNGTLDALGNLSDSRTGGPLTQPFSDSFLGAQSSLQRVRRAQVSLIQAWPRDQLSLSFFSERRRPLSIEAGSFAQAESGNSVTAAWSHELSPRMTATASLQYGRLERQGSRTTDVFGASATLFRQLQPRLNGYLQYGLTNRGDGFTAGRAIQNVVLVGMRQTF